MKSDVKQDRTTDRTEVITKYGKVRFPNCNYLIKVKYVTQQHNNERIVRNLIITEVCVARPPGVSDKYHLV